MVFPHLFRFNRALACFAIVNLMIVNSGCSTCACAKRSSAVPPLKERFDAISYQGKGRTFPGLFTRGAGKPVLLLHEIRGATPEVLDLASSLADQGFKVYTPVFFGKAGKSAKQPWVLFAATGAGWRLTSSHDLGPVRRDVRRMVAQIAHANPGKRVTVIGNCLSASIALDMLDEPAVGTVVVCQPALPLWPNTDASRKSLALPADEVNASVEALRHDPRKHLISFHYLDDPFAPFQRTRDLALKTAEAGVANRHLVFVGAGPHPGKRRGDAIPGAHLLRTNCSDGHSTITAAPPDDLKLFRKELYQALYNIS